jgi:hypothetical protein
MKRTKEKVKKQSRTWWIKLVISCLLLIIVGGGGLLIYNCLNQDQYLNVGADGLTFKYREYFRVNVYNDSSAKINMAQLGKYIADVRWWLVRNHPEVSTHFLIDYFFYFSKNKVVDFEKLYWIIDSAGVSKEVFKAFHDEMNLVGRSDIHNVGGMFFSIIDGALVANIALPIGSYLEYWNIATDYGDREIWAIVEKAAHVFLTHEIVQALLTRDSFSGMRGDVEFAYSVEDLIVEELKPSIFRFE